MNRNSKPTAEQLEEIDGDYELARYEAECDYLHNRDRASSNLYEAISLAATTRKQAIEKISKP